MSRSVGLDIHTRGVRAVEVTGRAGKFKVTRYEERELQPRGGFPDPVELKDALHELFRGAGHFTRNNVVCGVESADTVIREIPLPFKNDDQIRKVIKFEAEHHLHDCDADDVVVQYTRVGESKEGCRVLVLAVRKDEIARRIDYARSTGVEPLAMGLDSVAVYNAVAAGGLLDEAPESLILHIGHRSTEMIFLVGGEVRALRSVRMGVDSITHGLARDMDIDMEEANARLQALAVGGAGQEGDLFVPADEGAEKPETEKSHAELEKDLFDTNRDEFVTRLKREYVRTTAALPGSGQPKKLIACGPGLLVPGLLDHLGDRIALPVEAFRASQAFHCKTNGTPEGQFDADAPVALGLALKGIGEDRLKIDFRQENLKVANKFELLKSRLAWTVSLLFLALITFCFAQFYRATHLQTNRFQQYSTAAYQSFATTASKYNQVVSQSEAFPDRTVVDVNAIEAARPRAEVIDRFASQEHVMLARLQRYVGGGQGVPEIHSALGLWQQIFEVIRKHHKKLGYIDIDQLEIRQDQVRIGVVASSRPVFDSLREQLQAEIPYLHDMEADSISSRPLTGTDYQRATIILKKRR